MCNLLDEIAPEGLLGSWASLGESLGSCLADRGDMARSSRNSGYSGDRIGPAHPTG